MTTNEKRIEVDILWWPDADDKKTRKEQRIRIVTHLLSAHPNMNQKRFPRGIRQIMRFHSDLHPFIIREDGIMAKWNGRIEDLPPGWTIINI